MGACGCSRGAAEAPSRLGPAVGAASAVGGAGVADVGGRAGGGAERGASAEELEAPECALEGARGQEAPAWDLGMKDVPALEPANECAALAAQATFEAEELMRRDMLVLQAQDVLVRALLRLRHAGDEAAAAELRSAPVFQEVHRRVEQYAAIRAELFTASDYALQWKTSKACLWLHAPRGKTWFKIKVVLHTDSPISKFFTPLCELDLQPRYNKMLMGPPVTLGNATRHLLMTRTLLSVLLFRVEVITEVMRFANTDVGFLAEHLCSTFPVDPALMPPKSFRNVRVSTDVRNLFLPCGGGKPGTLVMQHLHVEVGIPAPEFAVRFFSNRLAQEWLDSVNACAQMMDEEGNAWNERRRRDATGFYRELALIEAAAELRPAYSLAELPGRELLGRPHGLLTDVAEDGRLGRPGGAAAGGGPGRGRREGAVLASL